VSIELQISVYMKLDKMSALFIEFHRGLNFTSRHEDRREIVRCSEILTFFHVNAYGCSEIYCAVKKCESTNL